MQTGTVIEQVGVDASQDLFKGLVVAHAAVNGGMMVNFGRRFAEHMVAEGAEMHFFASRFRVSGCLPPIQDLEAMGGQYHGVPLPQHLSPLRALQSLVLMTITLRRLGVQVVHTRSVLMGIVGGIAAKLAGVEVIIHHQDDLFCRDTRLSARAKRIIAFAEKHLARISDRSLFISQAVLDYALAIGFPEEKCILVGMDLHQTFQDAAQDTEGTREPLQSRLGEIGVPENARIVGCVGRLAHIKGIDLFLEAAEILAPSFPEWVFVLKGNGTMREEIVDTIAAKGLTHKVFLLTDHLPSHDLPALYRCFDIFALPTRREGFGMVFAEAMALGVPVVGSRIPPVTEVVPDGCGILVEAENAELFAQALAELMSRDDLRAQLGERGRQHARATWCNWQAAERVIDVYEDLLSKKQPHGKGRCAL